MRMMLIFAMIMTSLAVSCISDRTPEEVEDIISKSVVFRRVNDLCTELSKPNGFHFVEKQIGGNTELTALVFYYQSDRKPEEVVEFYTEWAKEKEWKIIEKNRYVKDKQMIIIEFEHFSNSNIEISCKEKQ